jgi:serine/threonine-protein kinase
MEPGSAVKVILEVVDGPHRGDRLEFDSHETLLVGRGSRAQLRLVNDPHFSRNHFLLEVNPPRVLLRDLGSRNGTLVNGRPVKQDYLNPGDIISGGQTRIRFTLADAPSPAGPPPLEATQAHPAPASGPVIPGYEIVRELGRGGMGVVYLARSQAGGDRVALKVIIPESAVNDRAVGLFFREARVLSKLNHPRIVRFRETGLHLGQLYLAMEYVATVDLKALLAGKAAAARVRLCTAILCPALEGLHHAHGLGFVHRDVKPGNLLVSGRAEDPQVKVADFGLAKSYEGAGLSGMTHEGQGLGTVVYMAPEQVISARDARPAVDVYSAGATLYHLLSGAYPYDFPAGRDPLLVVLEAPVVPLTRRCGWVPPALGEIVQRALAREPADRFPSAEALRQALLPFVRGPVKVRQP